MPNPNNDWAHSSWPWQIKTHLVNSILSKKVMSHVFWQNIAKQLVVVRLYALHAFHFFFRLDVKM